MRTRRRRWLTAAKVGVSVGLLGWLLTRMVQRDGVGALTDRLSALEPRWLGLALVLHGLAVFGGVLRWRVLLRDAGLALPLPWLTRSFLIGRFIGAFTPSTAGLDGWRLWEVGRARAAMGKSAATIVAEKLVGLIGMALVCAALAPLGGAALLGSTALGAAALLALGATLGLLLMRRPALLARLTAWTPAPLRARTDPLVDALSALQLGRRTIVHATLLGVLSHLSISAVFFATAGALGLAVDPLTLLAVGNATAVAVLLPVSVGGVGVRESVAVVLLASVGVSATDAVLIALLGYLTGQAPALAGGVLFALGKSAQRTKLSEQPAA